MPDVIVVRDRDEAPTTDADDAAASDGDPFVIGESEGYLVNFLARGYVRALGATLAPHGVGVGQWAVLLFLWAEDGQSQAELSRRVAIDDATMVRTIDRMERDGLVHRVRDGQDRRRLMIVLTERGRELRDVLIPCALAVNEAATRGLTDAERRQVRSLMRRMIAGLDEANMSQERR